MHETILTIALLPYVVAVVFRHLRKYLNEDIVKELVGDAHAIAELEKEWEQLSEDRLALRQIFPSGESKVCVKSSIIMLAVFC